MPKRTGYSLTYVFIAAITTIIHEYLVANLFGKEQQWSVPEMIG